MDNLKKILLVNLGGLGDIVMMEPVLRALKERVPGAGVTLLTIPRSEGIAANLAGLDSIRTIPLRFKAPPLASYPKLLAMLFELRRQRFDVLINMRAVESAGGAFKMRLLTKCIAARLTIGRGIPGKGAFFDTYFPRVTRENANEVELTARMLAPLGIENIDTTMRYPVRDQDRQIVNDYLTGLKISGRPLIGLNPGAFRPSHRWPLERWQALIRLLADRYTGALFLVTGGPGERELAEQLRVTERTVVTNDAFPVNALAALLEKMDVFIANDTGPMHIAAAVGAKVVAIFGPGDEIRYAPSVPRERYRIVRVDSVPCERPCYNVFDCDSHECMTGIRPEAAAKAVYELL